MTVRSTPSISHISRSRLFSTLFHISLPAVIALALGCTSKQSPQQKAPGFRVALLTPGPISDQSWNVGAYQGLLRVRDSLGAQISHIQTKTPAEFEENFRQYGAEGYDLVFGHGFEFQDAAKAVAPSFPHTQYVVTSGNTSSGNVSSMVFGFAEPSYLAGMVAGAVTHSNRIGLIEIKWLGLSGVLGDKPRITGRHAESRAHEGLRQIAEYLDRTRERAATYDRRGFLFIFDGRRARVKPETRTLSHQDAWKYQDAHIVFDRDLVGRSDIADPIRCFCEPRIGRASSPSRA